MSLVQYCYIAAGGALGAVARYAVGSWVTRQTGASFPWGTFIINVSGCFILGVVATLLSERVLSNPNWRPFITIGFVGAYTTFSTYEYESAQLGSSWRAMANLIGSVVVGYGAVWLGIQLARWIAGVHSVAKS
ncbi:MAG TPA: fluoride efflux transporter CrcB [Capsulimonadaceae bacterium]|jgi:CrcB protein